MEYHVGIEEAIEQLDKGIKRLKIEYERFFSGSVDRPPNHLKSKMEALIHFYRNNPPKGFAHRFQVNSLISRFNILREKWGRNMRMQEMGIVRPHLTLSKGRQQAPSSPKPPAPPKTGSSTNGFFSVTNQEVDRSTVEALYRKFVDLHHNLKGQPTKVTLEVFSQRVQRCTDQIQKKSGCGSVDFLLAVDDNKNIRLKAKPGR